MDMRTYLSGLSIPLALATKKLQVYYVDNSTLCLRGMDVERARALAIWNDESTLPKRHALSRTLHVVFGLFGQLHVGVARKTCPICFIEGKEVVDNDDWEAVNPECNC